MTDSDGEPSPKNVAAHYRGEAGAAYLEYQQPLGELIANLDVWKFREHVRTTDSVVDFGCGTGVLLGALTAREKVGIEVNEHARLIARERGLRTASSARELEPESADVIVSNHALEHTLCPFDELRALRRVVKKDGKLVLWLPLDDWRTQKALRQDTNHHLYTWTPLLLGNLLAEAGFRVEKCRMVAHSWPPAADRMVRLPRPAFDAVATMWSVVRRRRQLMALAARR